MFRRVLIANRGEIAIRVARASAALGVESVGVYAPVDALSLHTRVTTIAREIPARNGARGGGEESGAAAAINGDPVKAYLDSEALIAIAKETGCDCVHPGYGFLAENADFARACGAAGLAFIGPRPETLALFGDKTRARKLAQSLNIPVIPGTPSFFFGNPKDAIGAAEAIGFPVMLKAASGGGGRGMRRVDNAKDFPEAFARCESEARAAFGDGALFVEKLIERPRHIEVQILGDAQGTIVHLWERDCSIQQRNQKVIEIATAPHLDADLSNKILTDAIRLARAAEIENAATIEFLVKPEKGERFFIEANPRIQVEHTVTEQVTGIDLVETQFRIAAGATLSDLGLAHQSSVHRPHGFAIQARIVALGPGTITAYREPSGPGIRVDSCGYVGLAPPPQFDPMFAKLIVESGRAHSFAAALEKTVRTLDEFHIAGLPTNLSQLRAILTHPSVKKGDARTTLIAENAELQPKAARIESEALKLFESAAPQAGPPTVSRGFAARSTSPASGGGKVGVQPFALNSPVNGGGKVFALSSPFTGEVSARAFRAR